VATALTRLERQRISGLAVPMAAFTIALYVGNALAPTLIKDAPITLLVLSPKLRWLFLASPNVDAHWYYAIPLLRATAVLTTYYLLGHWFGDRALRWAESRSGKGLKPVLWIERKFHRARVPVTFLFPGNVAAMLAGSDAMPVPLFFGTALVSIALRMWAVRALAEVFRRPLLGVLDWISDYQLPLTIISVALVVLWAGWSSRRGVGPEETPDEIVEDFEGLDDGPVSSGSA
jgi:membrane protein DedA with SNARE-associated domain